MSIYDRKYGGNSRNLWRKVYGYQNNRPQSTEIVNVDSATTFSMDLNKTMRHRDFFIIKGIIGSNVAFESGSVLPPTGSAYWEYYESNENVADEGASFFFPPGFFSGIPLVTITPLTDNTNGNNVQAVGTYKDDSGVDVSFSSFFNGKVKIRALYVSPANFAVVTSSFTASITCSGGSTPIQNLSSFTGSFTDMLGTPTEFYITPWVTNSLASLDDFTHMIWTETQSSSSSGAVVELSAIVTNSYVQVDYLAFKP